MAGYLGDDFDPLQPEDSDSVKFGASWIRDLKARVQRFAMTLFNLETGALRDRVVRHASLRDMPGLVAGTYNKVKVNSKGLVTEGANEGEQQAAKYYVAAFYYGGGYSIDTETGSKDGKAFTRKRIRLSQKALKGESEAADYREYKAREQSGGVKQSVTFGDLFAAKFKR